MTEVSSFQVNSTPSDPDDQRSPWDILMLLLSVYVVVAVVFEILFPLSLRTTQLLWAIDTMICVVFFFSFVVQLIRAPRKWAYMKRYGWVDLFSSIPGIPGIPWTKFLRFFRVLRALRIIRNYRGVRVHHQLINWWRQRRAESVLVGALIIAIFLLILSSLLILELETGPTANIETPVDALWWGLVTVSTVGYGDLYPVTDSGRLMASLLILAGVGLFTTLSGFLANKFFQPDSQEQDAQIEVLRNDIAEMKGMLQELLNREEGGDQDVDRGE